MTAWEPTRTPKMKGLHKVPLTLDLVLIGGDCEKHAQQWAGNGGVWVAVALYVDENKTKLALRPLAKLKSVIKRKEFWYKKVQNPSKQSEDARRGTLREER